MKKITYLILLILILLITSTNIVMADSPVAEGSAQLVSQISSTGKFDYRVYVLKRYLESHNSPLTDSAGHFVTYADTYDLDWRMVPAISGVESTFGKNIPQGSYNAYGWANGNFYFESWEDSIETVSRTLREKYYDNGATTINQIARRYAPPSTTWAWKVNYFMNEIDSVPLNFTL